MNFADKYIYAKNGNELRPSLKKLQQAFMKSQIRLYLATLVIVAITIALGGTRERKEVAQPKLRYRTSWPLKFSSGKPTSTPILYCGDDNPKGYYLENGNFTPYDDSADNLCDTIPGWFWIGSPALSSIFPFLLVVQYVSQFLFLKTDDRNKRPLLILIIVLVARYVYWRLTDEVKGSDFDSSDHVLLQSVFIWALLWDAWISLIHYDRKRFRFVLWFWDAFWVIVFLVSLGFTSGIFHTTDEMWAGWRDSAYFLAIVGIFASVVQKYNMVLHKGYQPISTVESADSANNISSKTDDLTKLSLQF